MEQLFVYLSFLAFPLLYFFWRFYGAAHFADTLANFISSNIFFPRSGRPVPQYAFAQAKAKKGMYMEAIEEYFLIAGQFTTETEPFIRSMEIAVLKMGNMELAGQIFSEGLAQFEKMPEQSEILRRVYKSLSSPADKSRIISVKGKNCRQEIKTPTVEYEKK